MNQFPKIIGTKRYENPKYFFQSWAKQRMRTKYDGYYDDQITGHREEWKRGVEIDMEEIVTLKLYTDFDKLQFALKRCLRFEIFDWSLPDYYNNARDTLEDRIRSFYHWR